MFRDLKLIAINHFLYFICSFIYLILSGFLLGGTIYSFIIAIVLYILSVILALSPLAEKMLRFLNGIRRLETNEEKEYLNPIFREVLNSMIKKKGKYGKRFRKVEIYIIDKMNVNAYALGKHTVAITKGAMKAFSEEQLKGVIAHELGHIDSYDTVANMFLLVGNGFFYLFISIINLIILLTDRIANLEKDSGKNKSVGDYLWSLFKQILKIILFGFSFLIKITLAIASRKREYKADNIAYKLGYGEGLINALYLLEKISLGDNSDFKQKMTASHPRTTARIGRLESYFKPEPEESKPGAINFARMASEMD